MCVCFVDYLTPAILPASDHQYLLVSYHTVSLHDLHESSDGCAVHGDGKYLTLLNQRFRDESIDVVVQGESLTQAEVLVSYPLRPVVVDEPVALSDKWQLRHNWHQIQLWEEGAKRRVVIITGERRSELLDSILSAERGDWYIYPLHSDLNICIQTNGNQALGL